jgi:hypothetical protein
MNWMRDRDSFDHAQEIIKPFGVIEHVLNWCKSRTAWRLALATFGNEFGSSNPEDTCFFLMMSVITWLSL